ncbi:MAG: cation-transporting P-type ATPase [Candidatus Nanopelagicales bacterium]|nr:cation-transporting P-type ATPase [Candidatus Nanopelagicales bacterium]
MTATSDPSAESESESKATATPWFACEPADVLAKLGVDQSKGLSADEVKERRQRYGPNSLPAEKAKSGLARFVGQYANYMQIILLVAAAASIIIGQRSMGVLLIVVTLVNAVVGMRQEGKAASAVNALQRMAVSKVKVRRDGNLVEVDPTEIVPGDIIPLVAGSKVPADGRILVSNALQIDESELTGESTPASKQVAAPSSDPNLALGDRSDMAFNTCAVTRGSGEMVVTDIGSATQVGQVASMLKTTKIEMPPLARQMNVITIWIALAAAITLVVMFVVGYSRGMPFDKLFDTAVALAIAAIPEALPTVVVVILSLGSVALAQRNAVVKSPASVETLGEVSAINSDKTGTLTLNRMTVVAVVDSGHEFRIGGAESPGKGRILAPAGSDIDPVKMALPYVVANDGDIKDGKGVGDPLDVAFLMLAEEAGLDPIATRSALSVKAEIPFDAQYKFAAVFTEETGTDGKPVIRCYAKGAVPALLARSSTQQWQDGSRALDDAARHEVEETVNGLEGRGLRVMVGATRELPVEGFDPGGDLLALVQDMTLGSITGMIDPPRDSSKDAIAEARAAHIEVRMVTGDDVITASAIAQQLGIPGKAITGAELNNMSDEEALDQISDIGVIARVAPADKERLVRIMQRKGYVVAATGDGVNDAPALKAADIGVAMGTGTDVAKQSGRMILQDDNFATIVYAVEQGRAIYDNLQKYLRFILITLVAFVLMFLVSTLLNIAAGQPLTPAQILWINFFIDGPLGVALGFDKEIPGLMKRKPLARGANILTRGLLVTSGGIGVLIAAGTLAMMWAATHFTGSAVLGSSMAVTTFGFFRIVSAWQSRSEKRSALTVDTFDNKQLNWMVVAVFVLMVLGTQLPFLAHGLGMQALTGDQWIGCLGAGVLLFLIWEVGKLIARAGRSDVGHVKDAGVSVRQT